MSDQEVDDIRQAMDYVESKMEEISEWGLEAEVIVWALKTMKEHPHISIQEAFYYGCAEWDI